MKRIILLAATCVCAASAQEFTSLFDGKTLNGWKVCDGRASYQVEDGAIVGRTVEGSPNSFLCTTKEYGDFVLEFETKTDPALNSGVQIRSHKYGADTAGRIWNGKAFVDRKFPSGRVYGYQVEIANEQSGASGGIYDEARRGWLHNTSSDAAASKAFKDNQWNKYRVEARGDTMRVWVNGVAAANVVDPLDQKGFIGLQVHQFKGPRPAEVRWRNIRIQDLGRQDWKPIWNGESYDGWAQVGGGKWQIENGTIHAKSDPAEESAGYLISDLSFTDGTARVRFKIKEGNSGFFIRTDKKTMAAYEVEIDAIKGTGGLWEVGGRKWVTGPQDNAAVKTDDWNELTASVHGDRIVFHLNGVKTVDLPNDAEGRKEGVIAIQCHGSKRPTEIWFKDLAVLQPVQ